MKWMLRAGCLGFLFSWFIVKGLAAENPPNQEWATASPEELGLDPAPLAEMFDFIKERKIPIHSLQIVRHGRLVLDAYFYPYAAGTRHDIASATKSITSTLVGLAIDKKHLRGVDQPLFDLVESTGIKLDERKRKLTLEHLLTMQTGWDCGFEPNEARLFEMRRSGDWLRFMLDLPMVAEPGTRWAYCSGNCHVLSVLLTQAVGTNALAFARRELFAPVGIEDVAWHADPRGNNYGWGDLQLHPRDMAKIGQLFLQRGRWGDRQVISERWIQNATRAHVQRTSNNDHYGYFWWVKGDDYPGMFEAVGRGGQRINVWPAKDLVLVFTGGGFEPGDVAGFIIKSIKSDEPLPPNPKAEARLKERLAAATQPPPAKEAGSLPPMAASVSGEKFRLAQNSAGFSSLSIKFDNSAEAQAELFWEGRSVRFPLGLDGVERFSVNPIVDLRQAAKGQWLKEDTFLLTLDLVGGINFYSITLKFSDGGKKADVSLSERTGLNQEQFGGTAEN